MNIDTLAADKKLIIFELDDVLFPQKDYLLQVYYLFAQFIEYTEQKNAGEIVDFMRIHYEENGTEQLFEKVSAAFELAETYRHNFELLHENARLPLKLLLYKNMLEFLQKQTNEGKKIAIVTSGKPTQQLNKIRQVEWNGLEQYLTVYFTEELNQSKSEVFNELLKQLELLPADALVIGAREMDEEQAALIDIPYFSVALS